MNSRLIRVPELTDELIGEIGRIGRLRSPAEACGMLAEAPDDSPLRIIELPNRSMNPTEEYEVWGKDLGLAIEPYSGYDVAALWHTHPKGTLGPSQTDLMNVIEAVPMLLVTLLADGVNIPEWF